jgi:probable F420-dependent oxidoreductase
MKPFRFGITLFPALSDRQRWVDEVKRAEAAGFTVVSVSDHFRGSGGVFASLIVAYDAAPSMRIGTLVLNNDFWHPSLLAREVITADVLTDGAFELGLGAGWDEPDYRAIGLVRSTPGERIDRLAESLQVLEQAFSGGPVDFHGRYYSVSGDPWPKAKQAHIPLLIGGGSPRILKLAAQHADIVSLHRYLQKGVAQSWAVEKVDATTERVGWIKEAAGRRFSQLEIHAIILRAVASDRPEEAAAELGKPNGVDPDKVLSSPHYLAGTVDQMVETLVERRERWGLNYLTLVGTQDIQALAPVVARLSGS